MLTLKHPWRTTTFGKLLQTLVQEQAIFNALAELVNPTFGFSKHGLKAQCSTQPRASEATPWGFRIVEPPRPVRAKALILYLLFLLDS